MELLVRRGKIRLHNTRLKKGKVVDEETGVEYNYSADRLRKIICVDGSLRFGSKGNGREHVRPNLRRKSVMFVVQPGGKTAHKLAYWHEWENALWEAGLPLATCVIHA
jgi:hypothetical protein